MTLGGPLRGNGIRWKQVAVVTQGGPHVTQETTVTQHKLWESRVNCKHNRASLKSGDTGVFQGEVELSVHCESSVHCDTAQPHGNLGTIVMLWNLMEPSVSCEYMASWNPGATGTEPWLVEARGHCDPARPLGTQENIVGQWNPMEPSVICKNSRAS